MLNYLGVRLFREPDAGNLLVRFDEREQETESSQTGLRRRGESLVSSHRETKATAPVLDSTRPASNRKRARLLSYHSTFRVSFSSRSPTEYFFHVAA
jgi:hypothetical protein